MENPKYGSGSTRRLIKKYGTRSEYITLYKSGLRIRNYYYGSGSDLQNHYDFRSFFPYNYIPVMETMVVETLKIHNVPLPQLPIAVYIVKRKKGSGSVMIL